MFNFGLIKLGIFCHSLIYVVKNLVLQRDNENAVKFEISNTSMRDYFLIDLSTIPWECIKQFNNPNDSWQVWKSFFLKFLTDTGQS